MRFSQDFIEKVRDANNIVEIVSQYTELRGGGGRLMGRCPYPDHSDKSPSFSIDENRQLFHCFGCKKGGDVFNFLETYNGVTFPDAIEHLARRASIPLPEPEPGQKPRATNESKELFYKLNREAAVQWHRQLRGLEEGHPARAYLNKRGLSDEIVETFRLGVSTDEWESLTTHLRSRRAPLAAAETLGLVRGRKTGGGHFDLFRERIMFPIFSPTGEVVGFGGRAYGDGTPKYLNSPESPVFSKGRTFYALHETGKYIRSMDEAIVVEGYMDAIALYAAGLKNVVAILGTAFTAEHAKVLKRYTLNVTMLLDGDEAGMSAADRSLPILLQSGLAAKGFFLPEKLDPDDFIRAHGAEALRAELDRAPELFSLIVVRNMAGYSGTPSEKVRVVEGLSSVFRSAANPQLLELYWLELARRLDVTVDWVRRTGLAAMRASASTARSEKTSKEPAPLERAPADPLTEDERSIVSLKGAPRDEAFVLSLALQSETLLQAARDGNLVKDLSHSGVQRLLSMALERYGQKPGDFDRLAASLASQTDQPQILSSAIGASTQPEGLDQLLKMLSDYMNAIRKRQLKNQAKVLANQIRDGVQQDGVPDKLEQIMNLVRDRHSLDREP